MITETPLTSAYDQRTPVQSDSPSLIAPVLVGLATGIVQFIYLVRGGFFLDDFRNIGQDKAPLSLHLLLAPIGIVHFQPAGRFMVWLAAEPFHESYPATVALLAVLTGLGSYWLVRLLDVLFGPRRIHLLMGFLFGTSWVLLSTNQWFADSEATASVVFALGASLAFVKWINDGRRVDYVKALICGAVALLFWEVALAMPALLGLLWLCFAFNRLSARRVLLGLVPFAAFSLAFLAYVQAQPWHTPLSIPTGRQWAELVAVMVGKGVVPTVIGSGLPNGPPTAWGWTSIVIVFAGIVVGAVWLILQRRFRPSVIAFFVLGALLVSIPVATTRDDLGAAVAGNTARYLTFLPMLLAISVAGAPRRRSRAGHARHSPQWSGLAGGLVVLGALYLINLNATFDENTFGQKMGDTAAIVSARIGSGLEALTPSQRSSLVDSALSWPIWYPMTDGSGELSTLLPYWSATARTYGEGPHITGLDEAGTVRWATFIPNGVGPLYEHITVRASSPTVMAVSILGDDPTEPETPWHIHVNAGTHSYVLAAWSTKVTSVKITARNLRVLNQQSGTVRLGRAV